ALTPSLSDSISKYGVPRIERRVSANDERIIATADRDFSAASSWTNTSMSAYDESGDLSLVASAAGQIAYLPAAAFITTLGGFRYVIQCDVASLVGTFGLYSSLGTLLGTISGSGRFSCTFVSGSIGIGDLQIRSIGGGASADFDNFAFREAGAVLDLDLSQASRYFIPDESLCGADALIDWGGGLGPYISPNNYIAWIRGSTNTNGNERLLGAPCIPAAS